MSRNKYSMVLIQVCDLVLLECVFRFQMTVHCSASVFFFNWTESAVFLTIAFVIRDRYLAYDRRERDGGNKSGLPLLPFMIISYFLVILMFTLSTASAGLAQASTSTNLSLTEADAMIKVANNLLYTFIAFYMVATILLIPMAFVAKKKAGSDKVCDNHV